MRNTLSKQEIHNWIDFLYSDLLQDNIYIGGYFFNLNQLKDFAEKKKQLDELDKELLEQMLLNLMIKEDTKSIEQSIVNINKFRINESEKKDAA